MTEETMLNREELLRLAALDVFGLLDPYEAGLYSRSFHNAPAAVQDEVVALQAAFASDTTLLHSEEPSPSLRERVLSRVSEAIEQEIAGLAPIPIYPSRGAEAERHRRALRRLERSGRVWRAMSFMLAACFVIMVFLFMRVSAQVERITGFALDRTTSDRLVEEIGPDYQQFISNAAAMHFTMATSKSFDGAVASLHCHPPANSAFVLALGLKAGRYTVVIRNEDGDILERSRPFESKGVVACVRIDDLDVAALNNTVWEVIDEADGAIALTHTLFV